MIVNNYGSNIGTQNNVEIASATASAVTLLQQASTALATDSTLTPAERAAAQAAIAVATREVSEGRSSRERLFKSLGALTGMGSIAGLISKVIDLF